MERRKILFEVPDKYISTNNMECASLVAKLRVWGETDFPKGRLLTSRICRFLQYPLPLPQGLPAHRLREGETKAVSRKNKAPELYVGVIMEKS